MSRDSGFGKLVKGLGAAAKPSLSDFAREGFRSLVPAALRNRDPNEILWVSTEPRHDVPLPERVASIDRAPTAFTIRLMVAADAHVLAEALRERRPRLLVAEAGWCDHVGVAALRDLHRHAPATDWILRWPEASPRWLDAIVACGARATIEIGDEPEALARAFDAVFKGELWLSRRIVNWLYATIVEPQGRVSQAPSTAQSSAPLSQPMSDLTPRESEVADLMRRGLTNAEIAQRLGVSVNTVKKHLASAYEKMGVRSRRQVR